MGYKWGVFTVIEEYISAKDRIISSSIEIISDAGLASLSPKTIAMRTNIDEMMLYKYYSNINELLVDIVNYYFRFDRHIYKTIKVKKCSAVDKISAYIEEFAQYYDNYYALSSLMLQYEELLNNTAKREIVLKGIQNRKVQLADLFQEAIDNGEVITRFSSEQLGDTVQGMIMVYSLNRRIELHKGTFKTELCAHVNQWLSMIKMK